MLACHIGALTLRDRLELGGITTRADWRDTARPVRGGEPAASWRRASGEGSRARGPSGAGRPPLGAPVPLAWPARADRRKRPFLPGRTGGHPRGHRAAGRADAAWRISPEMSNNKIKEFVRTQTVIAHCFESTFRSCQFNCVRVCACVCARARHADILYYVTRMTPQARARATGPRVLRPQSAQADELFDTNDVLMLI